jgi:hypothetical protein
MDDALARCGAESSCWAAVLALRASIVIGNWFVLWRRVNIFERWESQTALETFRSSGPDTEQRPAMLTVSVQEYDIADVRPVFGKEAE